MAAITRFDLILLGYRDDLAREQTLAWVRQLDTGQAPTLERHTPLPHRVLAGVDHDRGLELCAELRACGARVRLIAAEPESEPELLPPPEPAVAPRARISLRTVALVALVAASVWMYQHRPATLGPRSLPSLRELPGLIGASGEAQPARWPRPRDQELSRQLNAEAIALSEQGDFAGAVARLRDAIAKQPDDLTLRQNLKAVLHNWAIAELNAGHPQVALELAHQALEVDEDPRILLVVGLAHSRANEWAQAQQALERAVALGADDPHTLITLGKVYRQQGNRQGAVEMFQRARELGASGADFNEVLGRLERELDAEWDYTDLPSPHFVVAFAHGKNEEAATAVRDSLESAYSVVGRKLDFFPPERTPVVLYDSEEFHDITKAPAWMGALYDGRIKLPAQGLEPDDPILDRTIRHEYAHVLVSQLSHGRTPVWLNEGIAIWAEETYEGERIPWAEQAIADQELFYLDDLREAFTGLPPERVPVAYAQSYLAVRAMLEEYGPARVRELLTTLASGAPMPAAFERVFARSLADYEQRLLRSLTG